MIDAVQSMLWRNLIETGPMCLTRADWRRLEPELSDVGRWVLRRFLESLERQTKWIAERDAAVRDEAERIALIGKTMARAGLRSYTDEKGRIFVAAEESR